MSDTVAAPASRNSPCPCGSGRRYKDCHGALAGSTAGPGQESLPWRQSAYRAPDAEWAHLDETARTRLGAWMEQALALQTAGQVDEAARVYGDVIAAAPDTHDALHMLGVIELGRNNLDAAEQLLTAARALRPPYAAIDHNWQLVQDARIARARAQPEELAERALPVLVDLAFASEAAGWPLRASFTPTAIAGSTVVHLIGRVHAGDHDDGRLLRGLANLLISDTTLLWAVDDNDGGMVGAHRVRRVDGGAGSVPRGGTHVFAGIDFDCAGWIDQAYARRVIVFCQSVAPTRYLDQLRALACDRARPLELVFVSQAMAERFGQGHAVLPPLLDVAAPLPDSATPATVYDEWLIETPAAWPVGVVGQSQQVLCEPADGDFVKLLGAVAGRLHIYDPGRFRNLLGGSLTTRFFERRPGGLDAFLAPLRCFVHRTPVWWQDTAGHELYGAMARGVPVLCPRDSVHAERIEHGVDGFLYGTAEEALLHVSELRRAPALAAAMGRKARTKARALFDGEAQARRYRELVLDASPRVAPERAMKVA